VLKYQKKERSRLVKHRETVNNVFFIVQVVLEKESSQSDSKALLLTVTPK
jgi:hypothetical protein